MAPRKPPSRLRSLTLPLELLLPGSRSRPTQTMPCWAAKMARLIRLFSLSPDCEAELVKPAATLRSEEHTSELQSLMRISYAVFCLKKKTIKHTACRHHSTVNQRHSQ